ncbi:MAG: stage III sporulation protein AC [Clostridia bacterium]|nr:stage III sporulation protein AC [Clostridia bacterium]
MDADILFQIAAVGMIVAVLNLILNKSDRSEQALMVTIGGLVLVLALIVNEIGSLFETIRTVFGL